MDRVRKIILTPYECGDLLPHFPELDERKIKRLNSVKLRKSSFIHDRICNVITPVGVLLLEDPNIDGLYILNGKHRSVISYVRNISEEGYIVRNMNEIIHHTPIKTYGETGLDGILDAFDKRYMYIHLCKSKGIYKISDFVSIYSHLLIK